MIHDILINRKKVLNTILCLFLVSLENVQIDVQDLTRGLDTAKKELLIRQTMKVVFISSNLNNKKKKSLFRM